MVLNARRCGVTLLAALALCSAPILVAQTPPASTQIDALASELTARRTASAGRGFGALPTYEQAAADAAWAEGFLGRLHRLQPDRLSHDEWITYAMLDVDAGVMKDAAPYFWFEVPITPYASPLRGLSGAFAAMPLATDSNRQAYLDALNQLPVTLASYEARLRSQMQRGIVAPAEELRLVLPFVRGFGAPPASSPLRPSAAALAAVDGEARARFLDHVDAAIAAVVNPAVERLATFIDTTYRAGAPAAVGLAQYPGGRDYYNFLIRRHTGLTLTPEQIHEIGLAEVSRLEAELDKVRQQAGFAGTLAEFHTYLRTDTRFMARSADDIADRMMQAIARIEPKVDAWFPIKPKAPYGVRRLDPAFEASMTYGYYQIPTGSERTGYYLFNGFKPESRSVLMSEAVIYHELVPGHHFQIALQRENTALNPYRRNYGFTAFTEGWGEYASDVAGEMGMYADPYARAGRLAMDLFVSSRLVLDTGMNALGWPREKAMAFMREHTFESDLQIDTETLRYSADYHGQALAYKMGARRIRELRERSAKEQGAAFDLPAFHAWLLRGGAMPLTVLDGHVACLTRERHVRRP
ncbi:MAG TPA: DUF885 domain-containing protein [Vicinamibacterales bacterium]|nr:DUF885 domain-containing protein [Vicinamibacterales bacterium]